MDDLELLRIRNCYEKNRKSHIKNHKIQSCNHRFFVDCYGLFGIQYTK